MCRRLEKVANQYTSKWPDRFWSKVRKTDSCWEWAASKDPGGYGTLMYLRKVQKAHRLSWILAFGAIPSELKVLHKCDNRGCVNPDHLFLGTQSDNMRDAAAKGRIKNVPQYGADNPMSKLTEEKVKEMRSLPRTISYQKLAKIYGVSAMTAYRAVNNQSWENVQ